MAREKKRITLDFYTDDVVDKMLYEYVENMGIKSKAIKNIIFEHMNNIPPSERNTNESKEELQKKVEEVEVDQEDQEALKAIIGGMGLEEAFGQ